MKNCFLTLSIIFVGVKTISAQSAGSIDLSFDPGSGFNNYVTEVLIQSDGKILAIGEFTEYDGNPNNRIIRLNSDGSIDNGFNTGFGFSSSDWVSSMVLQPDGKILVAGELSSYNGSSVSPVIRLNSDGTLDNTFDVSSVFGFGDYAQRLLLQSTGKVLVSGSFISGIPSQPQGGNYVIRLDTDGSFDQTFNYQDNVLPRLNGDRVYRVDSYYDQSLSETRFNILSLGSDGLFDLNNDFFYPGAPLFTQHGYGGSVWQLEFISASRMIVGGDFYDLIDTTEATNPKIGVIDENTGVDITFNPGTGFNEEPKVIEYDGQSNKILVGGYFNFYQGNPVEQLVRLNLDGSLDNSFQTGSGFGGPGAGYVLPQTVRVQPDGKIVVAGSFSSYDGVSRNSIVRLNGTATSVSSETSENLEISVYPNPSNGLFRIETNGIIEYRVYNALGKLVRRTTTRAKLIDLTGEPSGIYVLRLRTENGWATQKLVKQ